jgi:hypothetical protein
MNTMPEHTSRAIICLIRAERSMKQLIRLRKLITTFAPDSNYHHAILALKKRRSEIRKLGINKRKVYKPDHGEVQTLLARLKEGGGRNRWDE